MTDLIWPDTLGRPLQNSYSYSYVGALQTKRVMGSSKSRGMIKDTLTTFNCSYLWTIGQIKRFDDFCKEESNYLSNWFNQELILGSQVKNHRVRIKGIGGNQLIDNQYKIDVLLECTTRFIISNASADFIMNYSEEEPEMIKAAVKEYDIFINHELPDIFT